jgi:hypothetical protein
MRSTWGDRSKPRALDKLKRSVRGLRILDATGTIAVKQPRVSRLVPEPDLSAERSLEVRSRPPAESAGWL